MNLLVAKVSLRWGVWKAKGSFFGDDDDSAAFLTSIPPLSLNLAFTRTITDLKAQWQERLLSNLSSSETKTNANFQPSDRGRQPTSSGRRW